MREATKRHEYEIQRGSRDGRMAFVGYRETTAVLTAAEQLHEMPEEDHVRLYHTYPSPGPVRRYVGTVTRDGVLHRST